MDFLDRVQAAEEAERTLAIAQARQGPPGPAARGRCLFCGEGLAAGLRWCDTWCRDTWQRQKDSAAKWPPVEED